MALSRNRKILFGVIGGGLLLVGIIILILVIVKRHSSPPPPPPPPLGKKYSCQGSNCVEDPQGQYTDPSCNNKCSTPPGKKYSCQGSNCVEDPQGQYTDPSCNNKCSAPPPPGKKYSCQGSNCIENPQGQYTTPNCDNKCGTPPPGKKYSCQGSNCIENPQGQYTDPSCNNKCGAPPPPAKDCKKLFPGTRATKIDKSAGMGGYIFISEDKGEIPYYLAASYNANDISTGSDHKSLTFTTSSGSRIYLSNMCPSGDGEGGCQTSTMGQNPDCGFYELAKKGGYQQFQLLDKTLEFDVNVKGVGCCCDLALYFVSMPAMYKGPDGQPVLYDGALEDFYCDANAWASICPSGANPVKPPGGGNAPDYILCPELDIVEINQSGVHITPHACSISPSNANNFGTSQGSAGMYMKGDEFTVKWGSTGLPNSVNVTNQEYANCSKAYSNSLCDGDGYAIGNAGTGIMDNAYLGDKSYGRSSDMKINSTSGPIHMAISFSKGTDGGEDALQLDITLSQGGNKVEKKVVYPNSKGGTKTNYGKNMLNTVSKGMVMVMSYWQDSTNTTTWLDGGNPSNCTHYSQDCKDSTCTSACPYYGKDGCKNYNCPRQSDCPSERCESCGTGIGFSNWSLKSSKESYEVLLSSGGGGWNNHHPPPYYYYLPITTQGGLSTGI
jgi:hypothetical protein